MLTFIAFIVLFIMIAEMNHEVEDLKEDIRKLKNQLYR